MYQLHQFPGTIRRLTDGADFPESDDCQAYLEYKKWIADGNTPLPAAVPVLNPLQQIAALEMAKPITHRMLRDLGLATAEIASVITGKPVDDNPAAREIKAMEAQIAALRVRAKAEGLIP